MKKVACIALVTGMLVDGTCFGQSPASSLVECTHVADQSARLRCYDDTMTRLGHKIAGDTQAAPSPTTAAVPSSPAQAPTPVSKQSEFGMTPEVLRRKRAAETPSAAESEELIARVRAVSERAHGELSIELDNDQVWVETQATRDVIAPAVGETVTIRRGALGSYFLTRQSGRALRVKRIQ